MYYFLMVSTYPPTDPESLEPVSFYQAVGYRPEESVGYLMNRIISLLGQSIEREMEPLDLTNAQWMPLFKLSIGQAGTVAELARECDLDAGSMTRLLDRMEAKQLCRRVRSVEDRRVVNLALTDAGRTAAADIPVVLSRVQNEHLAGFSEADWALLKSLLRRMLTTAQRLQGEATAPITANTASAATSATPKPTSSKD